MMGGVLRVRRMRDLEIIVLLSDFGEGVNTGRI